MDVVTTSLRLGIWQTVNNRILSVSWLHAVCWRTIQYSHCVHTSRATFRPLLMSALIIILLYRVQPHIHSKRLLRHCHSCTATKHDERCTGYNVHYGAWVCEGTTTSRWCVCNDYSLLNVDSMKRLWWLWRFHPKSQQETNSSVFVLLRMGLLTLSTRASATTIRNHDWAAVL